MKKYLLSSILLSSVGATAFGEVTEVPTTFIHNGETFVMESMKDYDIKSGGSLSRQQDNTFNDKDLIASSILRSWDPVWEEFTDKSKVEYEYDADARLVKVINYNNVAVDATADAEWAVYTYITYTYGEGGRLMLKEVTRNSSGTYFVTEHTEYEYDGEGRLVKESRSSSWSPTGTLALSSVISNTEFNDEGQPVAYTTDSYYNDEVVGTTYGSYTYDENGNRTVSASYKKNESDELVKTSETVFSFNDDNQVVAEIYYKNDTYTGQWGPYFRWNYMYDETYGYPVQKDYHVYSIDFLSESIYNTYKYDWKPVKNVSIDNIATDARLTVTVCGSAINVTCPEPMTEMTVYDMNGCALRSRSMPAANSVTLDTAGLPAGCYVVMVRGDFGQMAQKVVF